MNAGESGAVLESGGDSIGSRCREGAVQCMTKTRELLVPRFGVSPKCAMVQGAIVLYCTLVIAISLMTLFLLVLLLLLLQLLLSSFALTIATTVTGTFKY